MFKKLSQMFAKVVARGCVTVLNRKAEGFMEPGIMIAILAVLGGLLMTSLYNLFEDTILVEITTAINNIFDAIPALT